MNLKSIKVLLWAKRRRLDALEAEVAACAAALQTCADAVVRATAHAQACQANVATGEQAIERMLASASFRPEGVTALRWVLDELRAVLTTAEAEAAAARQRHAAAADQWTAARQRLQRGESQRDHLEERRTALLRAIDAEQEDTQDEESEEAAVARMVSRRSEAARSAYAAKAAR